VESLRLRLRPLGIVVEDLSITNFQFSESFNKAIEEKVTAEQLKLKADRDLERFRTEAEQVKVKAIGEKNASIARAEGEAQAMKLVSEQLRVSPQYIDWMQVNRWDGKLPTVTGGAVPMISVKP
jgi:regulator of protease activity HflC (stomatin/prohibitin superfamily)